MLVAPRGTTVEIKADPEGKILPSFATLPEEYRAAVDAVREWTFAPSTIGGRPVDVTFVLPVSFKLQP